MRLAQKLKTKTLLTLMRGVAGAERLIKGHSVDLFNPAFLENPYDTWGKLRETSPIHYSMALQGYWTTNFDVAQEVLLDKRFGSDVRKHEKRVKRIKSNMSAEQLENFENPSMLSLDPPDHSRIRKLASKGFLRKYIQSLEPDIAKIVDACLAKTSNMPAFDVLDVLAKPLPAIVIAEMMGLPESDHQQFQTWSEDLIESTSTSDTKVLEKGAIANQALINYFRTIIAARRGQPGDDLIGQLIAAEEAGDTLSEIELYNTCLLLLVAGHETTTRLISNGMYLLLNTPGSWQTLRENPALIPNAIEEMLRVEPPVQATQRFATEDMDFHGIHLKRGDIIFISIAAGNRDPAINPNPDEFDVQRKDIKQISFGYGIHLCIGSALARLEAKVAFEKLLAMYPELQLSGPPPKWGTNPFFRGHNKLMVSRG